MSAAATQTIVTNNAYRRLYTFRSSMFLVLKWFHWQSSKCNKFHLSRKKRCQTMEMCARRRIHERKFRKEMEEYEWNVWCLICPWPHMYCITCTAMSSIYTFLYAHGTLNSSPWRPACLAVWINWIRDTEKIYYLSSSHIAPRQCTRTKHKFT